MFVPMFFGQCRDGWSTVMGIRGLRLRDVRWDCGCSGDVVRSRRRDVEVVGLELCTGGGEWQRDMVLERLVFGF
jgi:hypothetical protein